MYSVGKGIILRSLLPRKRTLIVLDEAQGKYSCILSRSKSSRPAIQGMLAEYRLEPWKDTLVMSDIEPIALPAKWLLTDIFFLHGILELCTAHLAEGESAQAVLSLLKLLYSESDVVKPILSKKFFVCKLLFALGLYPSLPVSSDPLLSFLISCQEDSMFNFDCDEVNEKKLTAWLSQSLRRARDESQAQARTFPFFKALDIDDEIF